MARALVLLCVSLCVSLAVTPASAQYPTTYKWWATGSSGSGCYKDAAGLCKVYETALEACTDIGTAPYWNMGTGFVWNSYPNRLVQCLANYNGGCSGGAPCSTGRNAKERSDLISCPLSISTVTGSNCSCNSGYLQFDSNCTGGKNNGCSIDGQAAIGNPCNAGNGNKFQRETVYRGGDGLDFILSYNTHDPVSGPVGRRWRHSFDRRVALEGSDAIAFRVPRTIKCALG